MNSASPNSKSVIDNRSSKHNSKLTQIHDQKHFKYKIPLANTEKKIIFYQYLMLFLIISFSEILSFWMTWLIVFRVYLWQNFLSYLQINDKSCVTKAFIIIESIFKKMAKMTTYPYLFYNYIHYLSMILFWKF